MTEAKEKIWATEWIYLLDSSYNLYGELPHFYPYNTSPVRKAGSGESHSFLCLRVRLWPGSSHSQTSILNTLPRWLPFCYERGSQECCKPPERSLQRKEDNCALQCNKCRDIRVQFLQNFLLWKKFHKQFLFHHTECDSTQQVTVRNLIPLPTAILRNVFSLLVSALIKFFYQTLVCGLKKADDCLILRLRAIPF